MSDAACGLFHFSGFLDFGLVWWTVENAETVWEVIVHFHYDKMERFLLPKSVSKDGDTHYRSQFETGASGGLLNTKVLLSLNVYPKTQYIWHCTESFMFDHIWKHSKIVV